MNEAADKNPDKTAEQLWRWLNKNYTSDNDYQTDMSDIYFENGFCVIRQTIKNRTIKNRTIEKKIERSSFDRYFKRAKDALKKLP